MANGKIDVLALDDEPSNTEMMARAFHRESRFALTTSNTAEEACKLVQQKKFDLLLVDYAIPEMNGLQFVSFARPFVPQAMVIMITAFPELNQVAMAQRNGVVHHILSKPWSRETLMGTVERSLLRRELNSALNRLGVRGSGK